jgi:hypothetical protein
MLFNRENFRDDVGHCQQSGLRKKPLTDGSSLSRKNLNPRIHHGRILILGSMPRYLCHTDSANVDGKPMYEALSYTWGDMEDTKVGYMELFIGLSR